jgi:hypothetical protein
MARGGTPACGDDEYRRGDGWYSANVALRRTRSRVAV